MLLACEMPDKIQEMYDLAAEIKKEFYGNRIVLFAPLYLSNYCINGCVYCPYHKKNTHIARKKLTQEEIVKEVTALQDMDINDWRSRQEKIRKTIRSNIFWNLSKRFTVSNIKTELSAV